MSTEPCYSFTQKHNQKEQRCLPHFLPLLVWKNTKTWSSSCKCQFRMLQWRSGENSGKALEGNHHGNYKKLIDLCLVNSLVLSNSMLPNKHKFTRWWIRKSNRLYSNKCKSTLNSHIKNSHNLNFAKLKINPRKKSQDETEAKTRMEEKWAAQCNSNFSISSQGQWS